MKNLTVLICILFTFSAFSHDKDRGKHKGHNKHHHEPSAFEVIPLNSPVKESTAKFLLKVPSGFDIDKIKYKIKNASHLFEKDKPHQDINLVDGTQGKELHISVSKLPPGFYQLFVKVIDKKKKEHDFKTKYRDHAMFVIDDSLQVPMPDPKIDNATLLGVDSDNDGVADRAQRWINENFSSAPNVRLALRQYAMGIQNTYVNKDNKENSIIATFEKLKAQDCYDYAQEARGVSSREIIETRQKMRALFDSTMERIQAQFKVSENFHGQTIRDIPREEACNFNLQ